MRALHLEKLAPVGDVVAVLCCLGFGPAVGRGLPTPRKRPEVSPIWRLSPLILGHGIRSSLNHPPPCDRRGQRAHPFDLPIRASR